VRDACHLAQSSAADRHQFFIVAKFLAQRAGQCGRNHLRQMADPRAEMVMALGVQGDDARSNRAQQLQILLLPASVFLSHLNRGDEPHRIAEQAGVGVLDSADFFARHGMSRQNPLRGVFAEQHPRPFGKVLFGTTGIGDQDLGRDQMGQRFQLGHRASHRSGNHDQIAANDGALQIGFGAVDRATSVRDLQHRASVAADNPSCKSGAAQCQPQRATDKAGADDRDLLNGHRFSVRILIKLNTANHTPQRVVSLQPSATVTLRDLGLLDRLVACTKYCADVCPEIAQYSPLIVADSWSAQTEQIMAARPDLVLASVPYQIEAVGEILKAGVRFLGLAPRTLADIYADIAAIAGIMGASESGEPVIAKLQAHIEKVRQRAAGAPKHKVFCEEWGKPIIASQPWVAEMVDAAGGTFISEAGKTTTAEAVAAAQPEVILAAWCGAGDRVPLEKIVERREWQQLPAVRSRRVFCINDELLNTPASSLLGGLDAIAWALHPELFEKPQRIRQIGNTDL